MAQNRKPRPKTQREISEAGVDPYNWNKPKHSHPIFFKP